MDRDQTLATLHGAIATMDLPEMRKTATEMQDLRWIGRNMGLHNAGHPDFPAACEALHALGVDLVIGETLPRAAELT